MTTTVESDPAVSAPVNVPPGKPTMVVYVPDVASTSADDSELVEFAQRFARLLDHQDGQVAASYESRAAPAEPYGNTGTPAYADVREIVRTVPGREAAVTHRIYRFNYDTLLAGASGSDNLLSQFWSVGSLTLKWGWLFLMSALWRARSLGWREKISLVYGGGALAVILAYAALLFIGVVYWAVSSAGGSVLGAESGMEEAWSWMGQQITSLIPVSWRGNKVLLHGAATLAMLAGVAGLSFGGVRAWLAKRVEMFTRFSRYFDSGYGRAACVGQFNDLLEHICESECAPNQVDVIGYSLGGVVALDVLFPSNGELMPRAAAVSSFTTIGCPFDLVRAFWPAYFEQRFISESAARMPWINVFSPVDLLGSNFANEPGVDVRPSRGINCADPGSGQETVAPAPKGRLPDRNLVYDHAGRTRIRLVEVLLFGGFLAHSQYWVRGCPGAESCYSALLWELYGKPRLRSQGATAG